MVLAQGGRELQPLVLIELVQELGGVGPRRNGDGLALQVVGGSDAVVGAGQPFKLGYEGRDRERNLLLAGELVGRRAALDVDRAVGDQGQARCRRPLPLGKLRDGDAARHAWMVPAVVHDGARVPERGTAVPPAGISTSHAPPRAVAVWATKSALT